MRAVSVEKEAVYYEMKYGKDGTPIYYTTPEEAKSMLPIDSQSGYILTKITIKRETLKI
jgi:hypothetical protein